MFEPLKIMSTEIKFRPWVGNRYESSPFGKKILILGESHYGWKGSGNIDEQPDVTERVVSEQLAGNYIKRFWTNIATAFLNRKPTLADKREFWNSVAFYNYVQCSVGDRARIRPTSDKWQSGESAFFEVLESLTPKLIVVLGYALWDHLPIANSERSSKLSGHDYIRTRRYLFDAGSAFVINVKHPSTGFNGLKWHPCISEAIQAA